MMESVFGQVVQQVLLDPYVWLVIILAGCYGVFMGAVPGLTATMGVALLIPVVYFMEPIPALAALVTLVVCAVFAGDIPNAILRIPGTPASAAYTDDAYALARKGRAAEALGTGLVFAAVGGVIGLLLLILFAPFLANFAARTFSVIEYFWLYLLGLTCAVVVSRGSVARGLLGLIVGLLLASIGLSAVHAEARLTFGRPELYQGINFIPAMIGLFGVSEILRNLVATHADSARTDAPTAETAGAPRRVGGLRRTAGEIFAFLKVRKAATARSGLTGAFIGMLPGAGADIAAWVAVAVSKRFSRRPSEYGAGSLEGIGDGSVAKGASLAGAWVPALVFAVPGDSITAIIIGVLLMKDIVPGPDIFSAHGDIVQSIYVLFILANLILLPIGALGIGAAGWVQRIPSKVLLPLILLFCIAGSYAINGSYFDVLVMGFMGLLGFFLERRRISLGPVVLGIILGPPLEERFIQAMSAADGNWLVFFSRPVAAVLGILAILIWVTPALQWWRSWKRT